MTYLHVRVTKDMSEHVDSSKDKDKEEIKITFRSSKDLLRQLKHYAADNDTNVTEILNQAAREYLKKQGKGK